jgi:hypothetical protein
MACATLTNMHYLPESVTTIPDEYLDGLLDEKTMRSLNGSPTAWPVGSLGRVNKVIVLIGCVSCLGTRVADAILETLTTPSKREAFRTALRLLKYWVITAHLRNLRIAQSGFNHISRWIHMFAQAAQRGIYANKAGYLAGVQLAIMVAKIVQFYPNALAATVVAKFFKVFTVWHLTPNLHRLSAVCLHYNLAKPHRPEYARLPAGLALAQARGVERARGAGVGDGPAHLAVSRFVCVCARARVCVASMFLESARALFMAGNMNRALPQGERAWAGDYADCHPRLPGNELDILSESCYAADAQGGIGARHSLHRVRRGGKFDPELCMYRTSPARCGATSS